MIHAMVRVEGVRSPRPPRFMGGQASMVSRAVTEEDLEAALGRR